MIKEISQKNSVKKRVNLYLILSTIVSLAIIIFLCGYWFLGDFGFLNRILSQPAPANKINLAENYSSTSPLRKETSGFREDETKNWNLYSNSEYKFSFRYPETWQREGDVIKSSDKKLTLTVIFGDDLNLDFNCFEIKNQEIIYDRGIKLIIKHFQEIGSYSCGPKKEKIILMNTKTKDGINLTLEYIYHSSYKEKDPVSIFEKIIKTFTFYEENEVNQLNFNIKTFFSPSLGITFNYPNIYPPANKENIIEVLEKGNKVYIYRKSSGIESGQYVEVFFKEPRQTLEEVIKEKFLKNYSERDCFVKKLPPSKNFPSNFTRAIITFPKVSSDDKNYSPWIYAAKCPQNYTAFNGVSFFAMDLNHPDKFFFFNIGQYAIMVDEEKGISWEETFKVLN